MTKSEIDALLRRTKAYGCDIRANHDSLMLVGELADALHSQQEEIERLRTANDWLESMRTEIVPALTQRAERAEAERDALRADAERYRWLRINPLKFGDGRYVLWKAQELDETIDAALAQEKL